jgi:hypothetical protein
MDETNTSEIARIREQIALEYQAANRVFTEFTPTAQHQFITKRQENIEAGFRELQKYMPPAAAMAILAEIDMQVHSPASSGNTS